MARRVVILGAAGRDFHDFNVAFRHDPETAAIPARYVRDVRMNAPVLHAMGLRCRHARGDARGTHAAADRPEIARAAPGEPRS